MLTSYSFELKFDIVQKRIRRQPGIPIPEPNEEWRNSVSERTVYIKGFPPDTTSLDDILNFLQTFGKVDNVFVRSFSF